jgi:hypothetical protein
MFLVDARATGSSTTKRRGSNGVFSCASCQLEGGFAGDHPHHCIQEKIASFILLQSGSSLPMIAAVALPFPPRLHSHQERRLQSFNASRITPHPQPGSVRSYPHRHPDPSPCRKAARRPTATCLAEACALKSRDLGTFEFGKRVAV